MGFLSSGFFFNLPNTEWYLEYSNHNTMRLQCKPKQINHTDIQLTSKNLKLRHSWHKNLHKIYGPQSIEIC